jgi:hypothetical protein
MGEVYPPDLWRVKVGVKMKQNLTPIAKRLRKESTEAEKLLWQYLRGRQIRGVKFRRQQPIGPPLTLPPREGKISRLVTDVI